jgi:hypothetical protein
MISPTTAACSPEVMYWPRHARMTKVGNLTKLKRFGNLCTASWLPTPKRLRASFAGTTMGQAGAISSFRDALDGDVVHCRCQMHTGRYYY